MGMIMTGGNVKAFSTWPIDLFRKIRVASFVSLKVALGKLM